MKSYKNCMYIGLYFKNKLRKLCNVFGVHNVSISTLYEEILNRDLGLKRDFVASITKTVLFFRIE